MVRDIKQKADEGKNVTITVNSPAQECFLRNRLHFIGAANHLLVGRIKIVIVLG